MTTTPRYQRSEDMVEAEIDGDLVMMHMDTGKYFGLDPIARHIWALLEQPISQEALCDALMQDFEVSEQQCTEDVSAFLARLLELGIAEAA